MKKILLLSFCVLMSNLHMVFAANNLLSRDRGGVATPETDKNENADGEDVNAKDPFGKTALMKAAEQAGSEVVQTLIDAGADVDAKGSFGETALMSAVEAPSLKEKTIVARSLEVVQLLIDAGADVNAKDSFGKTALMKAAKWTWSPEIVQVLIDAGANVNAKDDFEETALMEAAWGWGRPPKFVKMLIDAGADVNAKNKGQETVLMRANDPEAIKMLLDAGADVYAKNNDGETALIYAAKYSQNPEVAKILIDAGIDINVKDTMGKTALMAAKARHSNEFASVLMSAGAKFNEQEFYRYAVSSRSWWQKATLEEVKKAVKIIGGNINVLGRNYDLMSFYYVPRAMLQDIEIKEHITDEDGRTILMYAAMYSQSAETIKALIDAGADVNVKNKRGNTALMYAAGVNDNSEVVKALLDVGADVDVKDDHYGNTALMYAAMYSGDDTLQDLRNGFVDMVKNSEIVRALIEAGADVNVKNNRGNTALMYEAMSRKNPEIVKVLLEAGAEVNAENDSGYTALMYANGTAKVYFYSPSRDFSKPRVVREILIKAGARDAKPENKTGNKAQKSTH